MTKELVAISVDEYERLLQYKEAWEKMIDAQIQDNKIKMQMMEMDMKIKQAMPPFPNVQPIKGIGYDPA